MSTQTQTSFKDQYLIAMPQLESPHFHHSLTYMVEHSHEGAMGIVINRPLELRMSDVLEHIGLETDCAHTAHIPIYSGGPVQTDRGFILHDNASRWEMTAAITQDIHLTTSQDILEAIANGSGPSKFLIALGYAGWSAGQLEQEIAANAWLNTKASDELIFDCPIEDRWHLAAKELGVDLNLLSTQAGHA